LLPIFTHLRSSTKPTVASILPLDEKSNSTIEEDQCSSAALVTVTQVTSDEDSTIVLAEEEGIYRFLMRYICKH